MTFYNQHSTALVGAAGQPDDYFIDRSLRFRSSASAYLNRTLTTGTDGKRWTWSGWVKRGNIGASYAPIFAAGSSGSAYAAIWFQNDLLGLYSYNGATVYQLYPSRVFRDPSAWYHIQYVYDSTQATASDRLAVYINGTKETSFAAATYPALNYTGYINSAYAHYFGQFTPALGSLYFDGYLAEVNFIDGQALDSSYFGKTDLDTGVWKPIEYTGTYGTNGFYLNFSDNTSTTTLGYDTSGNSNNWTCNNISLTAGSTYDSMQDVPTLTSADAGNFCTLNPLYRTSYVTSSVSYTNGNLKASSSANNTGAVGSMPVSSGKWYFEAYKTNDEMIGWHPSTISLTGYPGQYAGVSIHKSGNVFYAYQSDTPYGSAATAATIGCAVDFDNQKFYWSINGTWQNSANPASNTGGFSFPSDCQNVPLIPAFRVRGGTSSEYVDANFGQRPFAYTPPTGYKALNTYNLPDPTIADGSDYFNTLLWTGTGATRSITGVGFQPDFVWIKKRSSTDRHCLFDAVRGAAKQISTDLTSVESTPPNALNSFDSDGYTVGNSGNINDTGFTYVGWNWKANGSGVSNTDGSITSTVSANTSSGFSIVTYTGNGVGGATVGHGLGIAPRMIIVKNRSGVYQWLIQHASVGPNYYFHFLTDAAVANVVAWNNTAPTSSVFSIGSSSLVNTNGQNCVAYCFAPIEGYSAFGSYTGNGSTDGPFIYTGFRPAWLMVKRSDVADNWVLLDSARNTYNVVNSRLFADLSQAEGATDSCDFTSNGFKVRGTPTWINASGGTLIYAAFAENPFKYSLAR